MRKESAAVFQKRRGANGIMTADFLREIGITFLDGSDYSHISPLHAFEIRLNEDHLGILNEDLENGLVREEADKYAREKAEEDLNALKKAASDIFDNYIYKDPEYEPFAQKIKIINLDLPKALESAFYPISLNLWYMKYASAYVAGDDIVYNLAYKYAKRALAEFAYLSRYDEIREIIKKTDPKDSQIAEVNTYKADAKVMERLERLEKAEKKANEYYYNKRFDEKIREHKDKTREHEEFLNNLKRQYDRDDSKELKDLILKLTGIPHALDGMVAFTYDEIKKRDAGMDKDTYVSLIEFTVSYTVNRDRIDYTYDSGYSNPLSSFVFEKNNYSLLESDAQCAAVAIVLGQTIVMKLKGDPDFEMADVSASGSYNTIEMKISYPNINHQEAIRLF